MTTRNLRKFVFNLLIFSLLQTCALVAQGAQNESAPATATPAELGLSFVNGSNSQLIVERGGKRYKVDLATQKIEEINTDTASASPASDAMSTSSSQAQAARPSGAPAPDANSAPKVYEAGDDFLFSLPTGRRLDRHGVYINFTHRFPYSTAFSGPARGAILLGLDDVAVPSFGFRYGITSKLSVSAYRSPSIIGRPIEFMAAYNLVDEHDGKPLNAAVRFSVDGQDDFSRNFTTNFEVIVSRSITHRAQLYAVPTISIHNRPVIGTTSNVTDPPPFQPCGAQFAAGIPTSLNARPCANTVSIGVGAAVDIRPTVALVAEGIPTLVNGPDLGIHRPAYSFGIQKKIWRHAFTFGFTNAPGTTVSQRAGTRATYLGDPNADKPSGMFVGFDLSRQTR